MRSVKRGRSQSIMSGVIGLLMSIGFFAMAGMVSQHFGAMAFMPALMGIIVVISSIYSIMSGTRKNRFSEFDITDGEEEPDPLNQHFGGACDDASGTNGGTAFERDVASHRTPFTEGGHENDDSMSGLGEYARHASGANDYSRVRSSGDMGKSAAYCPYCGAHVQGDYEFCAACGRKLPDEV